MNRMILAAALLFAVGCSKSAEEAAMPAAEDAAAAPADAMPAPADGQK